MPLVDYINEVTDFDYDAARETAREYTGRVPGFFTPYRSVSDFACTIVAPIAAPLSFAVLTGLFGVVVCGLATITCGISFLATGIFGIAGNQEMRDEAFSLVLLSSLVAITTAILAVASALATVTSCLALVAALVTRTGATGVSMIDRGVNALIEGCSFEESDCRVWANYRPI